MATIEVIQATDGLTARADGQTSRERIDLEPVGRYLPHRTFGVRVALGTHVLREREAVHFLWPADRDRDPAGPVPRVGIVGHIDDREATEVFFALDEWSVGDDG